MRRSCRDGILAIRPDGLGDVLLTGPAVAALAASGREVSFLAGPAGTGAAALLPGVSRVLAETLPWIDPEPAAVDPARIRRLVRAVRRLRAAEAVIFSSFHQSPLPTALVLRMASVRRISAISEDYPGSLLDVRHQPTADIPEARRNLSLARAAGFRLPPGHPGTLAIRGPLPDAQPLTGSGRYVVVHPGASVPARHPSADRTAAMIGALAVMTQTEVLLVIIGGIFVIEALSVAAQVFAFKTFRRRVLLMAPLHHHFEMLAWSETKIMLRFWIIAAVCSGIGFTLYQQSIGR